MSDTKYPYEPVFSIAAWLKGNAARILAFAKANIILLTLSVFAGGTIGVIYDYFKSVRYNAEITFIVEDSKNIGGGLLSALGGQLGLDIGSLSGSGNGVLSGDNVLELLKSKSMMAECLKTPYSSDSTFTLADKYAEVYKLRRKWKESSEVGREIFFGKIDKDPRIQDSLLKVMVKRIEENELNVYKPDKKLGFFRVAVNTKDELLSKYIAERIIRIATDFYIDSKTGRLRKNVDRLQQRTDSLEAILNSRTYRASAENKLLLNANPAFINQSVSTEIKERDKIVLGTVYAELMKNLEISKTALIQETPTIQVVDHATLPLDDDKEKWYYYFVLGGMMGFALAGLGLGLKSKP